MKLLVETTFFTAVFNVVELFLLIREKMLAVLAATFLLITIIFGLPFVIIQNFKRYGNAYKVVLMDRKQIRNESLQAAKKLGVDEQRSLG
ncbi:MAG: hypothetical protein ABSG80_02705 [Verrucomicrobiota bacterium]